MFTSMPVSAALAQMSAVARNNRERGEERRMLVDRGNGVRSVALDDDDEYSSVDARTWTSGGSEACVIADSRIVTVGARYPEAGGRKRWQIRYQCRCRLAECVYYCIVEWGLALLIRSTVWAVVLDFVDICLGRGSVSEGDGSLLPDVSNAGTWLGELDRFGRQKRWLGG